ncbi:MAG: saccharopine dehydrogenase NADP-binding domain-containing protein [Clostridiales Family XIII bacterium]|jgi:saccharopine dehydrogenase-like NADP-dependent oxidoreductase|nr:saccharopine dehydrogenase NADP-binding domain-containing protein [Clostridiales Family XIII bacterium]
MKLLIIGAGGVGTSAAHIIKRAGRGGNWAKKVVIADYNEKRAKVVAEKQLGGGRFKAAFINAADKEGMKKLFKEEKIDFVLNAVEPAFNVQIFDACFEAKTGYMDCAMTLSKPPGINKPYKTGDKEHPKLGDYQFSKAGAWKKAGLTALVGSGVEPGMADVFAKFAAKHLFDKIDEVNVRDGDNYTGGGDFGFSVWTTIEECLNPPVVWEKGKGWFTTERFSEPEVFNFPGGIGDVEVFNVEHEEVMLVPREIKCNRVTFKYGVPRDFQKMLFNLEACGLTEANKKIKVGNSEIAPRDFLVKTIPSPVNSTLKMKGKGCAGTWVKGIKNGKTRSVYLYQVADNQECIKKYGTNSVVAQTAVNPVIMLELLDAGIWKLTGVHGPESFEPEPFIERLEKYEFPAGIREMESEYADAKDAEALKTLL